MCPFIAITLRFTVRVPSMDQIDLFVNYLYQEYLIYNCVQKTLDKQLHMKCKCIQLCIQCKMYTMYTM